MAHRLMPWWYGYFLLNPFRKYWHNTNQLLGNYLKPGAKVVDYGCAMGYFSLTMARLVGPSGKIFAFDIQPQMIERVQKRAAKAGLSQVIEARLVNGTRNIFQDLKEKIDFELLFAVAHEVEDQPALFDELFRMMKPGGLFLFAEPIGHVSEKEFNQSVSWAEKSGFIQLETLDIRNSNAVLFRK